MKARLLLAGALPLLSIAALNCSDASSCEGATCGDADGGAADATVLDGSDAGTDGVTYVAPPGCDTAQDISPQAACVTESNGLFVDSIAPDGGTGTKAAPFNTIGAAVAAASGARPNVFICARTYAEQVKLSSSVNLYGGFSCSDWSYAATNVPKIAPTAAGYALQVTSVAQSTIEDLEFDAFPGASAGDSSIAVFLSSSTVTFTRASITAGPAGATPAKAGTQLNYPVDDTTADGGLPGSGNGGQGQQTCASCLLLTLPVSTGGGSGGVGGGGVAGGPTIAGGDSSGAGGGLPTTNACNIGIAGADGLDAGGGATVDALGSATAAGWTPASGLAGQVAPVAQGGGGGSGAPGSKTGGGGGGGCGGCGGGDGLGGVAGGSTFAVLSYMSATKFSACTLTVKAAANGGAGGDGQVGQLGGNGGNGTIGGAGCQGAGGGNGSMGGGGSGGPGGIAAAVGYVGASPMPADLSGTTVTIPPSATTGGPGGDGGAPAAVAGPPGKLGSVVAL